MSQNKSKEPIINHPDYNGFNVDSINGNNNPDEKKVIKKMILGQNGTEDKMSQDEMSQDEMSQDKMGQEDEENNPVTPTNKSTPPEPATHQPAPPPEQNVPGQNGTEQNVPGQNGTEDKMSQKNSGDSQNVPGQNGTEDKMSQDFESPDIDESVPQYIVSHYLFTRALIDYSLTLALKPNSRLIMIYFISQGIIAADFTQEDIALKLAMSRKTAMRALKDLLDEGYIIKPEEQPHKLTRISFVPLLDMFLADKGLTYLEVTSDLKNFIEATPICSSSDAEIGYSLNPNISWDKMGQEATVMYSRFSIKPLTYYTGGSRDKLSQENKQLPTEIKITNRQDIHLERIYFWGYLFDFTETRMTEATLEKLLEYIPINDETYTEELTTYEQNIIYTYMVQRARQPWNYLLSTIKEGYYKSKFTPEIAEKYIRLKKVLIKLKESKTTDLQNEILKIGYDVIKELIDTFEFGYKGEKGEKGEKGDIVLIKAAEKIAFKVKSIESNYMEFKIAHKINKFSHREEIALKTQQGK